MKTILILSISLTTSSYSNDIEDFEIEGISIGDSLLDYFNEEEIKKFATTYYDKSDKFYILTDNTSKYELYPNFSYPRTSLSGKK